MALWQPGILVSAQEKDGKIIVTPYPATEGFKTFFTGAGDQISPLVRGGGDKLRLSWDNVEDRGAKTAQIQFAEPVEIHDGEGYYTGAWTMADLMDFAVTMPATDTEVSGSGNCNLVEIPGGGGANILVPASGDGGHEVDLTAAVPVPADLKNPDGYWDVDNDTGEITPSDTPGQAAYHLLDVAKTVHFVRNVALGHPLGVFSVEPYKAEWLHQSWLLKVIVNKQSAGAGEFAGWLLAFRRNLE